MRDTRRSVLAVLVGVALCGAGCAASGPAASSGGATAGPQIELRADQKLELAGSRGELRSLHSELRVELRPPGRRGVDAGVVTLAGVPLDRGTAGRDTRAAIFYRLGAALHTILSDPSGRATLIVHGSAEFEGITVDVPFAGVPRLDHPYPGSAHDRALGLEVRTDPLPPGTWMRVTLGDGAATAVDRGLGRWEFTPAVLSAVPAGSIRLRLEIEASCGACPAPGTMRLSSFSRIELDVPLTLL